MEWNPERRMRTYVGTGCTPRDAPFRVEVNARLAEIGESEGIPLAATADAHYVRREEARAHEVLFSTRILKKTGLRIAA